MVNWKNKEEVKEYHRKYMKNYNQIPKVKKKIKEYQEEYYQRPEVKLNVKKYKQEYNQRPEVKKKQLRSSKKFRQKEGYKEKRRENYIRDRKKILKKQKEYSKLPEIKVRRKEYCKKYYYSENKKCPDCGKLINNKANKCKPCSAKEAGIKIGTTIKQLYRGGILKPNPTCFKTGDARVKLIRSKTVFPVKDTKIEVKIQMFLEELGYEYFTHQYMKEIEHGYQCDILIPSMNLVIECDRDYWHKYPIGKELDHIRTSELLEKGFKVLRLWECEINEMNINKFKEDLDIIKQEGIKDNDY